MRNCKIHAFLTAVATFILVWIGGLVTSHGAGMAVPDWPNTFGYNMFFFPISKWIGGIFYEHTHRLVATGVGLLVTILVLWLHGYIARPTLRWGGVLLIGIGVTSFFVFPNHPIEDGMSLCIGAIAFGIGFVWPSCEPAPKWLRRLGVIAFALVVVQGLLGGFRVTQMMPQLGIVHGKLAQIFFVLTAAIALFLTDFWNDMPGVDGTLGATLHQRWTFFKNTPSGDKLANLKIWYATLSGLILFQLVLGATMRHQHAGLAIPDFPLAYGKVWPDTSARAIDLYNQSRIEAEGFEPITSFQVWLQMVHRLIAYTIATLVIVAFRRTLCLLGWQNVLTRWAAVWAVIVVSQGVLGAVTIWTGKSADIATLHVAGGALSLVTGVLLTIVTRQASLACASAARESERAEMPAEVLEPKRSLS